MPLTFRLEDDSRMELVSVSQMLGCLSCSKLLYNNRCFWHSLGSVFQGDPRDPKVWLLLVVVAVCVTFCSHVYNP